MSGLLRNTIANWSAFFAAAAVSFFLSPFIVHRLGDASYGIWVVLGSLVGCLGLLDFGVRGAVTRFVASYHAKADHRGAAQAVNGALRAFAVLATVGVGVLAIIGFTLEDLFNIPLSLLEDARSVVLHGGVTVAVANLGLSLALIGSMGIIGVALGTTITSIALSVGFLPWYFKRELGVGVWQFVARIRMIPSSACLAFGIATFAFERWVGAASLPVFYAQVAATLPLVALGAAFLVFSREERADILARLITALPSLSCNLPRRLAKSRSR